MARFRTTSLDSSMGQEKDNRYLSTDIYAIFIMRESGCPLFYRTFKPHSMKTDPSILCGLFSALNMFVSQVTSGESIERLDAGRWQFTFQSLPRALIVLCSAKHCNPVLLNYMTKQITKLLLTDFKDRLQDTRPITVCDNSGFWKRIEQILLDFQVSKREESLLPKVVG
ncbi:MAG: hypothetical protein ACFFCO_05185 [Promethearchaeota archaeon]